MKVVGTQYLDVEISLQEQKRIALKLISERFDVPQAAFVTNGRLMVEREIPAGSHSWFEESDMRKATPNDEAVILVMQMIRGIT